MTLKPDLVLQAFKPGRVVAARVTGARPMDGLAACTLKASAMEGGTLTFDDITTGQLISGTVDGVEDFGVFVKLAPGLKCAIVLPLISNAYQVPVTALHASRHACWPCSRMCM